MELVINKEMSFEEGGDVQVGQPINLHCLEDTSILQGSQQDISIKHIEARESANGSDTDGYERRDSNEESLLPSPDGTLISTRPRKKPRTVQELTTQDTWAMLGLRYLLYARKLACHNHQLPFTRQLPSITHMIAIADTAPEETIWRWCDAYHAIKYLKDNGLVTTSRGAKGTSIKNDAHTIDDLIKIVKARCQSGRSHDQQGQIKEFSTPEVVNVHVQVPEEETVSFTMHLHDLHSLDALSQKARQCVCEQYSLCHEAPVTLVGYIEKETQDFIHANMFTSADELVRDADEICLSVHL